MSYSIYSSNALRHPDRSLLMVISSFLLNATTAVSKFCSLPSEEVVLSCQVLSAVKSGGQ